MNGWVYASLGAIVVAAVLGGLTWLVRKYRTTAEDNSRLIQENEGLKANAKVADSQIDILVDRDKRTAVDRLRAGEF